MNKSVSLVTIAQQFVSSVIVKGDTVIDATVGNGLDTLFLSRTVGPKGKVYGYDIQAAALKKTLDLLEGHGCDTNTHLTLCCHSQIGAKLRATIASKTITAAMFNLGYLPGSDKNIITQGETTIAALNSILPFLADSACISILAYPGHPGGELETEIIAQYCKTLSPQLFEITRQSVTGTKSISPVLFSIRGI